MKRTMTLGLAIAALAAFAHAQSDARRASRNGSRGDRGKCTIEVVVDGVAEVEIQGDQAILHTLAGLPSRWVRFECNDTLPRQPDDFKFSGVDGRGRQSLIRDPRGNRGVAVIRIEDPKGGSDGYTFDIEWRGSANSSVNSGRFGEHEPGERNNGRGGRSIEACKDAVRGRADKQYGYRDLEFGRVELEDIRGRNDSVQGRFVYKRGFSQEEFEFTCSVETDSGRVRSVDMRKW